MNVIELYSKLANKYEKLGEDYIKSMRQGSHLGFGDSRPGEPDIEGLRTQFQAEFMVQALDKRVSEEELRDLQQTWLVAYRAKEDERKRELDEESKRIIEEQIRSLSRVNKLKLEFIQKCDTKYRFNGLNELQKYYKKLYTIYSRNECLGEKISGYAKYQIHELLSKEVEINEKFAKEMIAVEHVFLVLKNLENPTITREALAAFLTEVKPFDSWANTKQITFQSVQQDMKSKKYKIWGEMNDHLSLEPKEKTKLEAAYSALHKGTNGYTILRFYDKTNDKFLLDEVIEKRDNEIQVLPTLAAASVNNFLLSAYDFTFTKVFHSMQDRNHANLVESILNIQSGTANPLTLITFGQSGSGKSTTALGLLYALVKNTGYTYRAVQWYLTKDADLKTTHVLHDLGAVINNENLGENKYTFIGKADAVENEKFVYAEWDGGEPVENNVSDFEKMTRFEGYDEPLNFQQRLERVKFTRSTLLNKESSRSVLFFTIYDRDDAKYSLIDLPGNEELGEKEGEITERQKETNAIGPVLEMFKSLFLAKKMGYHFNELRNIDSSTRPGENLTEEILNGFKGVLADGQSFGDFCDILHLNKPNMLGVLDDDKSKLVLLLTAYGVTKVDGDQTSEKLSKIFQTTEDTFKFSKRLEAAKPKSCDGVQMEEELNGGKSRRNRRFKRKTKRARK